MILCVLFKISLLELVMLSGACFGLGCLADKIRREICRIMDL